MRRHLKNLRHALHKARWREGREWYGYLTPCEIIALIRDGAQPTSINYYKIENAQEDIKKGKSNPRWFYFTAGKTALAELQTSCLKKPLLLLNQKSKPK